MDVYWLEQDQADVPADDSWLGPAEAARLRSMRFAKRRADWRLGRWTAKRALIAFLRLPPTPPTLARIEVRAARSGAPEFWLAERPLALGISLSHRAGRGICAVAQSATALGCDIEVIEPRSASFASDYFTAREQVLIAEVAAAERARILALLWSAKESALKALGVGLRWDTRRVAIALGRAWQLQSDEWAPLEAHCDEERLFEGWWQQSGRLIRTLVSSPPPDLPLALHLDRT